MLTLVEYMRWHHPCWIEFLVGISLPASGRLTGLVACCSENHLEQTTQKMEIVNHPVWLPRWHCGVLSHPENHHQMGTADKHRHQKELLKCGTFNPPGHLRHADELLDPSHHGHTLLESFPFGMRFARSRCPGTQYPPKVWKPQHYLWVWWPSQTEQSGIKGQLSDRLPSPQ